MSAATPILEKIGVTERKYYLFMNMFVGFGMHEDVGMY